MEQTQLETGSSLKLRLCCERYRCGGYRGEGGGFKPDNPDLILISCKEVFLLSEVFNFCDGSAIFNNDTNILALVLPYSSRN